MKTGLKKSKRLAAGIVEFWQYRGAVLLNFKRLLLAPSIIALLVTANGTARAQQLDSASEYKLKAAFIYNFSQFIEWPETAFAAPDAPFQICVAGDDPFGDILKPMQKRKYHAHPIQISYPKSLIEASACQILYLTADSKGSPWRDAIKNLGDAPILTVTSNNDAMESGFCIGFVERDGKTRWNMNLAASRKAQLKVSAKLIEIAVLIVGEAAH